MMAMDLKKSNLEINLAVTGSDEKNRFILSQAALQCTTL